MPRIPWKPGDPCPKCQKPVMTERDKFQKGHNKCRRCGNLDQSRRRKARKQPRIPREKPVKVEPIKEPMTCTKCKEKPQKLNSRKGLCEACTVEDTLAKARIRAAEQHRRRMADTIVVLCACGCGERCRSGATYATKQHRETHERETREKHRQPRSYDKPPQSQKLQRMTKVEKREVVVLPVLDTEAERARVAELLERARAQREATPVQSRWERGSLWD
jgi:hypothetical protein